MPSAQVIDLNPEPRTEYTPLEKTLSGFSKRHRENQIEEQETDALKDIYGKYQKDGKNLEQTIMDIQTRPGISPTTRVNSVKQLLEFQEHNGKLQKQAKDEYEKAQKKEQNKLILSDIEARRGLAKGELAAYEDNPSMAESITRPAKGTQASRPVDEDQLKRIDHITARPDFMEASPAEKNLMLLRGGVSKENSKAVIDPLIEEAKLSNERKSVLGKKQAETDVGFVNEQIEKIPQIFARQQVIEQATALNEEGVTGQPWDLAMQKAGLLQYTDEGYRVFASLAKDAVKNQNIKSVIGSQISQMEFGFFRDATISERFSKEANRQIMKKEQLALRYEKLYADITKKVVEQNDGEIPVRIQQQVNDEFSKQAEKISKELRETAIDFEAIQNVPKGKVLMYDKKRRPLHVPANEVEKYTKLGASLS